MNETLKVTNLALKNLMAVPAISLIFLIPLLGCFVPSIPSFFMLYAFLMVIIMENGMFARTPYRFILPVSVESAVRGRLIVSLLFFLVQLAVYVIAAIVRKEQLLSDLAIIMFTLLNCFSLFMSFFYAKKRAIISIVIIGAFCGLFANIYIIFMFTGGNIGLGVGLSAVVSALLWLITYFIARKIAYKQYV